MKNNKTNKTAQPERMNLESLDVAAEKRELLRDCVREAFPEALKEDMVDFDQLKRTLGEWVEPEKERFGLNWHGKAKCMQVIQQPSVATLKPSRDESVNFDETENLFIEGDNLEVLKLLQKSYFGKVKMIYIDPPYNTGKEFIYPDKYGETLDTYLQYTGQKDGNGRKFSTNTDTNGRYHSNWLKMMYPRLYFAKNLLKDNGVIVIHIDEHECTHLQLLLDEIYGPDNCLGSIVWNKLNPKGDATRIATQHESILIYAKSVEDFKAMHTLKRPKENAERMLSKAKSIFSKVGTICVPSDLEKIAKKYGLKINLSGFRKAFSLDDANEEFKLWIKKQELSEGEAAYKHIDENGSVFRTVSMAWPNKKQAPKDYFIPLKHPITGKPCPVPERGWRNPSSTMAKLLKEEQIVFGEDETKQPERKYILSENMDENIPSVLPFGGSDDAILKELGIPFDNPKPMHFVKKLLLYFLEKNEIVLDFFSGSCTTAHAVMQLNKEDGDNRRFICVQLPESCDEKSEAYKAGYKTIADIGKERIRRAAKKIEEAQKQEENGKAGEIDFAAGDSAKQSAPLDFGFKAFSLASSNFKIWDGHAIHQYDKAWEDYTAAEKQAAEETLLNRAENHVAHTMPNSAPEDILYEILLKAGYPLTAKVEELVMAGKKVFSIDDKNVLICLDRELNQAVIDAMAKAKPRHVVFLDAGFRGNDQLKANAAQAFKARAQEEDAEIVFRTV